MIIKKTKFSDKRIIAYNTVLCQRCILHQVRIQHGAVRLILSLEPSGEIIQKPTKEWTIQTTRHEGTVTKLTNRKNSPQADNYRSTTQRQTGERTCTQKLTITSQEKFNNSSANLWWQHSSNT